MNIRPAPESVCIAGGLVVIGFLFCASGASAGQIVFQHGEPRDRLPPPKVGTSAVKGRVVDGATGSPIARARVRIGGGVRPWVMTDASGAFAFAGLPAGPYTLSVDKRGYLPAAYPERGRGMRSTSKPLILQDGQTLDGISVPLYRGGVITGRVVDANGEPLEWVQIRAFKVRAGAPGGGRASGGDTASTNDLGEFRLARLDTGSYVLMATPQQGTGSEEPGVRDGPAPQPAPTYYPDVVAMDQAQAVPVQRGQTVSGIDITMSEALMGVITGTVIDPNGQPAGSNTRISIGYVAKDGSGSGSTGTALRPDGTFRAFVAPGVYAIEAASAPPPGSSTARTGRDLVGTESVTVTSGSSETVLITLGRGAIATGRVVFEGTSPLPENLGQVSVVFRSTNGHGCSSTPAEIAADWSFKIEGLTGTCTTMPMFAIGRWMLKAVIHDGEDLVDRVVTFKAGQQYRNVQVVFTDRRSEIVFRVSEEGGQTTREYVALVFPSDKTRWDVIPHSTSVRAYVPPQTEMLSVRPPMPASGAGAGTPMVPPQRREAIEGLRPGEYLAIAVDNIEYEDTRDPAVLEKLAAGATRVTLGDGASIEVPLRRLKLADLIR
jgi:hypothetical protein